MLGRAAVLSARAELPARRRPGAGRYFFVVLACVYAVVPLIAFAPEYGDLSSGKFKFTFSPSLAYAHGALMMGWLLLFMAQAGLAAAGALQWHRTLGLGSIVLAVAMWVSMGVESVGQAVATKDVDTLLLQIFIVVLFALFFVRGVLVRRDAGAHRRLMTLAALVLLQAAVDRITWLPEFGLPWYWPNAIRLDVLLVPLFVFDVWSIRRIHPVTLAGSILIVAAQTAISLTWANPSWQHVAHPGEGARP